MVDKDSRYPNLCIIFYWFFHRGVFRAGYLGGGGIEFPQIHKIEKIGTIFPNFPRFPISIFLPFFSAIFQILGGWGSNLPRKFCPEYDPVYVNIFLFCLNCIYSYFTEDFNRLQSENKSKAPIYLYLPKWETNKKQLDSVFFCTLKIQFNFGVV